MDMERARNNVETLFSLGEKWLKLMHNIRMGYFLTGEQLHKALCDLRELFAKTYDDYVLQMKMEESAALDVEKRCSFSLCADCEDSFICLTENVTTILRCRNCGIRSYYEGYYEGGTGSDSFAFKEPIYVGTSGLCPVAVCAGRCRKCGYTDTETAYAMPTWLQQELSRSEKAVRREVVLQETTTKWKSWHRTDFPDPSVCDVLDYKVDIQKFVGLLAQAASPCVLSLSDFVGLLQPDPVDGVGDGILLGLQRTQCFPGDVDDGNRGTYTSAENRLHVDVKNMTTSSLERTMTALRDEAACSMGARVEDIPHKFWIKIHEDLNKDAYQEDGGGLYANWKAVFGLK